MEAKLGDHLAQVRHLREAFAEANERLVRRLRASEDAAAERVPDGGWSAAQIGWHVAHVTTRFAGLLSGDVPGAQPLPPDFRQRPWKDVAAGIPDRLEASPALQPPRHVTRGAAIAELEQSALRMARAFDALTPERGARLGVTHPLTGAITLYQLGEWAAAHAARHERQMERALARG